MKMMLKMFIGLTLATIGFDIVKDSIFNLSWIFWIGLALMVIGLIIVAREIYSKDKENRRVKKTVKLLEKKA